jgi:hypothetical protein
MLHYPPDSLRTADTTRTTGKDLLAAATLILGAIANVAWIGFLVVLIWRWLNFA